LDRSAGAGELAATQARAATAGLSCRSGRYEAHERVIAGRAGGGRGGRVTPGRRVVAGPAGGGRAGGWRRASGSWPGGRRRAG